MAYTTIDKPSDYFNTKLHTGDGGGSGSSTGIGFQPDMVWSKSRTEALNHTLFDSVRGAGSNKELTPNGAGTEGGADSAGFGYISAFNSDGYSWTAGSTNTENFNKSSQNYVNWCWLGANGTASNTDGSITSTVSANTTSGFSIVSYTGTGSNATIGHGLGATSQVVLIKELNGTNNWLMSHQPLSASLGDYTRFMTLNSTSAVSGPGNVVFQNSAFTSSVFNVGTSAGSNGSGQNYIAYCFADVQGYSKFGIYTGNGNADGTFVYTGFKTAWLMIKKTDSADAWFMFDNKRAGAYSPNTNPSWEFLLANATNIGATTDRIDLYSNGFKMRYDWVSINESGGSYIYMAFAENPFVTSTGIPTTAR
jgi:hypothetical protein